jgi:hypothetical protein
MNRGQNHALGCPIEPLELHLRRFFGHQQQRINHSISCHRNVSNNPRGTEVLLRLQGRSEMQGGDLRQQPPIGLLWERIQQVVGP